MSDEFYIPTKCRRCGDKVDAAKLDEDGYCERICSDTVKAIRISLGDPEYGRRQDRGAGK